MDSDTAANQVLAALPDWGNTTSQLNAEIARRMGVTLSDLDALHTLNKHGPATAATLATRVGLTSGSVSRMIDRLDEAGCVERIQDPHDRRRVLIEPTSEGLDRLRAYYAELAACTRADLAGFTEAELTAVLRFIHLVNDNTTTTLTRLRTP
ncbi:MarR family winged helix-turn-helix transcriptional regulator [Kibdelosporangium phytohabitans]|uniref:MarR family transcriptional regulator n=1 Tax=Kibdelosporangium phytohabitans TaxID=860235 RepID=A0A0N9HSF9_9PSEU|nr:MarR family transcriptional regulator [Kibdelosporangium phytohabitans]ALG07909.1 MarR family transcriptional regulator [Kibdelosporangium phytohabitans]MBE1471152.1 DNA-binding MarR family transcriptional regulator [Kibdelosporangium phytohabitans]